MSCLGGERKSRNKLRLTIALYNVPQEPGEYSWAFILTPKPTEPPTSTRGDPSDPTILAKFRVTRAGKPGRGEDGDGKLTKREWRVERGEVVDIETDPGLHVLVTVGKVTGSVDTIEETLKEVPVPGEGGRGGNPGDEEFDDYTWVRDALQLLRDRGLVTGKSGITGKVIGWDELADAAENFAESMNTRDRDEVGWYGEDGTPCFDMLSGGVSAMT